MLITTSSTVFAMAWGGVLGVLVALVGGKLDALVMRVVDALVSVPWIRW